MANPKEDYYLSFRSAITTADDGPDLYGMFQYGDWKDVFTARCNGGSYEIEWGQVEYDGEISARSWGSCGLEGANVEDENGNWFLKLWFGIGAFDGIDVFAKKVVGGVPAVLTEAEELMLKAEVGEVDEEEEEEEEESKE
ncbi:hypothetical protein MMC12_003227 [Toensbergia leucococca]|nr:hypothetical protein [Toensbergia leucococca]